jgi:hypothetical protein
MRLTEMLSKASKRPFEEVDPEENEVEAGGLDAAFSDTEGEVFDLGPCRLRERQRNSLEISTAEEFKLHSSRKEHELRSSCSHVIAGLSSAAIVL